jgi:hypothetical protein
MCYTVLRRATANPLGERQERTNSTHGHGRFSGRQAVAIERLVAKAWGVVAAESDSVSWSMRAGYCFS